MRYAIYVALTSLMLSQKIMMIILARIEVIVKNYLVFLIYAICKLNLLAFLKSFLYNKKLFNYKNFVSFPITSNTALWTLYINS